MTISLCFILIVSLPLVLTPFEWSAEAATRSGTEHERPPEFPRTLEGLLRFPGRSKQYFLDNFATKQTLRELHGWFEVNVLRTSPSSAVTLGRSGWLFLASEAVFDYHRGQGLLGESEAVRWAAVLRDRSAALGAAKIKYVFVVAPNSHTIYPQYLPESVAPLAATTRLDELASAIGRLDADSVLVDLRPVLSAHAKETPLYFKTDTHWNSVAAFLSAAEIARRLGIQAPRGELLPLRSEPTRAGDLARLVGLQRLLREQSLWPAAPVPELLDEAAQPAHWQLVDVPHRERVTVINPKGTGTALVFRDSFGEALIPWISSLFHKTIWVWSYSFSEELVRTLEPDVVIEQIVERKLHHLAHPGGGLLPTGD